MSSPTRSRLRPSRRALFICLILGAVTTTTLEVGQRISDRRADARRRERPYTSCLVTTAGEVLSDRPGRIALVLDPHLLYRTQPDQRLGEVTINSLGLRAPEVGEKAAGTLRIVALGGSTAFGYGASSDDAVWTTVLRRAVAARLGDGPRVEVINAGVIGYDSMQERLLLETRLLALRPDLVITLDGGNDMFAVARVPPGVPLCNPIFYEIDRLLAERESARAVLRWSAFYRAMERRFKRVTGELALGDVEDAARVEEAVARYRRNLAAIVHLSEAAGARVLLVAQPELATRAQPLPEAEQRLLKGYERNEGDPLLGDMVRLSRSSYSRFRAAAAEVAAATGHAYFDASSVFDGRPEVAFDDLLHLNDDGNRILGEALGPAAAELLGAAR